MVFEKEKFPFKQRVLVRWGDMDALGHVNNVLYMRYLEQGRIDYLTEICDWDWTRNNGLILAKVTAEYRSPLFYGDRPFLYIRCSRTGRKSFDLEYYMVKDQDGKEAIILNATTVLVMYDYRSNSSIVVPEVVKNKLK